MADDALSSLVTSTDCLLLSFVGSIGGASDASASDALLFPGSGFLSAVSDCFFSLVAGGGPLSVLSSYSLSFVTGDGPLSAVSDCLWSFVADDGPLFDISGRPLTSVAGSSLLSTVFGGGFLSLMPAASSQALFLPSTPSYTQCSSLPSLPLFYSFLPSSPTPLTRNPTLFIKKRLFD